MLNKYNETEPNNGKALSGWGTACSKMGGYKEPLADLNKINH